MKEEKDNNKTRKQKIIKFTMAIIIIIIILLLHSCFNIGTVNDLIPTGNIDIFDININKSCCDDTKSCDCNCNQIKDTTENNKASYNQKKPKKDKQKDNKEPEEKSEEEEEEIEDARILDDDGKYNNSTDLRLFSNPAYEFRELIAPTSTNVYQFIVRNSNEFKIEYNLIMIEENDYDINMKYKLKKDGTYVAGDENTWVEYSDLRLKNQPLNANSRNVYQLEWKWFESSNDTNIGTIDADYKLKISFDGKEVV